MTQKLFVGIEDDLQKAKKGTPEYEERLRQYREKRGLKKKESSVPVKKDKKPDDILTPSSIKSQLKSSGISVPSGFQPDGKALSFKSTSNRAYNTLSDLSSNLQKLGWKRVKREYGGFPDGSNYSDYELFISPDGRTVYQHSLNYDRSRYRASFLLAEEKERQNFESDLVNYVSDNSPFIVYTDLIQKDGSIAVTAFKSDLDYYFTKLEEKGYIRSNDDSGNVEFSNKDLGINVKYDAEKEKYIITQNKIKQKKLSV